MSSDNNISDMIAQTKQGTERATGQMLSTLKHVPDDKLNWSPAETARTALQIATHCAHANNAFAMVIRGEELPFSGSAEEAAARIREAGRDVTSRDIAVQMLEESTQTVLKALDGVTPDQLGTSPMSPFGPFPFALWMNLSAIHTGGHARQIDYLETIWGDVEDHM